MAAHSGVEARQGVNIGELGGFRDAANREVGIFQVILDQLQASPVEEVLDGQVALEFGALAGRLGEQVFQAGNAAIQAGRRRFDIDGFAFAQNHFAQLGNQSCRRGAFLRAARDQR